MTGRLRRVAALAVMALLGVCPGFPGWAAAQDKVGQVAQVSGRVEYLPAKATAPANAAAFMKIAPGDGFTLGQGAVLRLVYFDTEREETWTGPGTFVVGPTAGQGRDGFSPRVSQPQAQSQAPPQDIPKEDLSKGGFLQLRGGKAPEQPAQ